MQHRRAVCGFVVLLLITLTAIRPHLRVLGQVVTTYKSFYPSLKTYPELVYQYNNAFPPTAQLNTTSAQIPRIMHRILLTDGHPTPFTNTSAAITSCQTLHPNWIH
ncbi:hypothetical protein BDY17DRAFT_320058 [Neohortaea acidophila]|uniref:Uncharacterized protein n=1 Tax=Neohortaea acidophila TaxID=245834 RepID=A0A6A6Q564_9PEZI|nr:uncharacterized protein BDY17DRAFT_320058 [Neohortaea acidophila]KAF2487520.1 hypothetical protein BDY17DRAFT_320058 [Neohortaea acidophila]